MKDWIREIVFLVLSLAFTSGFVFTFFNALKTMEESDKQAFWLLCVILLVVGVATGWALRNFAVVKLESENAELKDDVKRKEERIYDLCAEIARISGAEDSETELDALCKKVLKDMSILPADKLNDYVTDKLEKTPLEESLRYEDAFEALQRYGCIDGLNIGRTTSRDRPAQWHKRIVLVTTTYPQALDRMRIDAAHDAEAAARNAVEEAEMKRKRLEAMGFRE